MDSFGYRYLFVSQMSGITSNPEIARDDLYNAKYNFIASKIFDDDIGIQHITIHSHLPFPCLLMLP